MTQHTRSCSTQLDPANPGFVCDCAFGQPAPSAPHDPKTEAARSASPHLRVLAQEMLERLWDNTDYKYSDEFNMDWSIVEGTLHEAFQLGQQAAPAPGWQPQGLVNLYLHKELQAYLDTIVITSENIGDIRRQLFVPWTSAWNGIVREETAARENLPAPPGRDTPHEEKNLSRGDRQP